MQGVRRAANLPGQSKGLSAAPAATGPRQEGLRMQSHTLRGWGRATSRACSSPCTQMPALTAEHLSQAWGVVHLRV